MGAALLKNPDKVKDVSFSLVVACDLLEAIHMYGLPGWDVFYPGFKNCLYGRQNGTLFICGLHENVSTRDDFPRDNLQSRHNILAKRDGVFI